MIPNTGKAGEDLSAEFLNRKGFRIIERNFRRPFGELDIIAEKDRVIHFVEVKTSAFVPGSSFNPEIRVNRNKIKKLKRICEIYLTEQKLDPMNGWQIDVLSVIIDERSGFHTFNFIENAVFAVPY